MAAVNEQVIIELVARTEAAEKQIAKLTEQLNKTKTAAKKVSEEGIERIVKNGGAMGILNDLTGGLAMQFKDAYESIQLTNTGLKGTRAALLATGIGALVVALGAVAANWEDIVAFARSASAESQKQLADAKELVELNQRDLQILTESENILRAQGKTEKEILQMKMAETDEIITAMEAQIETQKVVKEEQIATAKRNKQILEGIIMYLTAPLQMLLFTVDQVGKALGQDFGLRESLNDMASSLLFDPEKIADDNDKAIEEMQDALRKMKNDRAGFKLSLTAMEKEEAEKRRAANEAALKAREKDEIDSIDRITQKHRDALAERQRMLEEAEHNAAVTRMKGVEGAQKMAEDYLKDQKQKREDELKAEEALIQLKQGLEANAFAGLTALAGKNAKAQKALALAQIGYETGKAFIQGLSVAQLAAAGTGPAAAFAFPIFYATQLLAIASAVGRAKSAVSSGGGGGGGGSVGSTPSFSGGAPTPTNPQAALDFSFLSQQQPVQTYVIAGDVTNAQEANQKLKDQSAL